MRAHTASEPGLHSSGHVTLSRWTVYGALSVMTVLAGWGAAATWFVVSRDDLVAALISRQAQMQYAYEDRLALMRTQVDRISSRQLLNQDTLEHRVAQLVARQSELETRHALVAALADNAAPVLSLTSHAPQGRTGGNARAPELQARTTVVPKREEAARAVGGPETPVALPLPGSGPARPVPELMKPVSDKPVPDKPVPDNAPVEHLPLRSEAPTVEKQAEKAGKPDVEARLHRTDRALREIETAQLQALGRISADAKRVATHLRSIVSDVGLDAERIAPTSPPGGMGGPFVPMKLDAAGGLFESLAMGAQDMVGTAQRLRKVVGGLPLARPINADADQTSGFGYRLDPFTRTPALHTGIDFRGEVGSPVRATAPGRVVSAEYNGGYGNMVEIEHANGLTTRFAHLSSMDVEEGQRVEIGTMIGRVGSTGRSTGPHLHYETRLNGDPVDPIRFLRAGQKLTRLP
jgi:murein DD-endopeptidase MepM/ murein hydrolase activator NlpD